MAWWAWLLTGAVSASPFAALAGWCLCAIVLARREEQ